MFKSFDMTGFGGYLREMRNSLNLTQKDVGDLISISTEALRKIESGMVVPRYETMEYLSRAYKTDILKAFKSYRVSNVIFNFYCYIDQILLDLNFDELTFAMEDFEEKIVKSLDGQLLHYFELNQFRSILKGIESYYKHADYNNALLHFESAMQYSIDSFCIDAYDTFRYTQLEIRILILLSMSISKLKDYRKAELLLLKALSQSEMDDMDSFDRLLNVKIFFNLSYVYHNMDLHDKVIEFANLGINYNKQHHISFLMAGLYFRRGIAKYSLGIEDFDTDLFSSINLLKAYGRENVVDVYRKAAYDIHGLII